MGQIVPYEELGGNEKIELFDMAVNILALTGAPRASSGDELLDRVISFSGQIYSRFLKEKGYSGVVPTRG